MRKIRFFLEKVGEALTPYVQEAERDVETLKELVSESVPRRFKVFALTTLGVILVHLGMVFVCLMSSAFWVMLLGKGDLPAAWFIVNFIILVGIYDLVLLPRWDEEGWQVCEVCGQPTPTLGSFCDQCGALMKPEAFPWLVEQK